MSAFRTIGPALPMQHGASIVCKKCRRITMKKYLLASACASFLMTGVAFAQTSVSNTMSPTSTTTPAIVAPPPGTLSTTETQSSNDSNGNTTASKKPPMATPMVPPATAARPQQRNPPHLRRHRPVHPRQRQPHKAGVQHDKPQIQYPAVSLFAAVVASLALTYVFGLTPRPPTGQVVPTA